MITVSNAFRNTIDDRFKEEIMALIDGKTEGSYWDFKEKHHDLECKLLHDILCMANNLEGRDAYLIFGVEDKTCNIVGVEKGSKYTLIYFRQFLKERKFAGDNRPDIDFYNFEIENKQVDVLIIKKSNNTPFYLAEEFKKDGTVVRCSTYTRVNDTNTDINKTADIYHVEKLWRRRFGIDKSIKERYNLLLDSPEDWDVDWDNRSHAYHMIFPEFQMKLGEFRNGVTPASVFYLDPNAEFASLKLYYHSTLIHETSLWNFDGYRLFLPAESTGLASPFGVTVLYYLYYDLSTVNGQLFRIFTKDMLKKYDTSSRGVGGDSFLIFKDDKERKSFDEYAKLNIKNIDFNKIREDNKRYIELDLKHSNSNTTVFHLIAARQLYEGW